MRWSVVTISIGEVFKTAEITCFYHYFYIFLKRRASALKHNLCRALFVCTMQKFLNYVKFQEMTVCWKFPETGDNNVELNQWNGISVSSIGSRDRLVSEKNHPDSVRIGCHNVGENEMDFHSYWNECFQKLAVKLNLQ